MYKIMVRCYSTNGIINQFAIGYMIKPSLKRNKVFREQVEKCLSSTFYEGKMETIKDCLRNKNTCVMALIFL